MKRWECCCGRQIKDGRGWSSHARACPVERARSQAFVEAIETGRDAVKASRDAVARAKRARA